jgi:hypothetical protein
MSELSNGTKKHTSKSRETIPLRWGSIMLMKLIINNNILLYVSFSYFGPLMRTEHHTLFGISYFTCKILRIGRILIWSEFFAGLRVYVIIFFPDFVLIFFCQILVLPDSWLALRSEIFLLLEGYFASETINHITVYVKWNVLLNVLQRRSRSHFFVYTLAPVWSSLELSGLHSLYMSENTIHTSKKFISIFLHGIK